MEFVCPDDDGDWYYYPEEQKYRRIKKGEIRATASGKYLPDPYLLLEKRRKLYPQAKIENIIPTVATHKLWEHWNAINKIAS